MEDEEVLTRIERNAAALTEAETVVEGLLAERRALFAEAIQARIQAGAVIERSGLTEARYYQIRAVLVRDNPGLAPARRSRAVDPAP